jgi:hypothetical protein
MANDMRKMLRDVSGSQLRDSVTLWSLSTRKKNIIFLPVGIIDDHGLHLRKTINLRENVWNNYYKPLGGQSFATILPVLLHPKSRNKRLKSKDFDEPLLIDPQYYADGVDDCVSNL